MVATMNAPTFMGKNFMDNQNSIMNSTDLTLKKMIDITLKLVGRKRSTMWTTSGIQQSLGRKDRMDHHRQKLQRL